MGVGSRTRSQTLGCCARVFPPCFIHLQRLPGESMVFDNKKHLIILLAPALLVLCIFAIYPVIQVTYYSFFEVDFVGDSPSVFVGLQNYDELFDDYFFASSVTSRSCATRWSSTRFPS